MYKECNFYRCSHFKLDNGVLSIYCKRYICTLFTFRNNDTRDTDRSRGRMPDDPQVLARWRLQLPGVEDDAVAGLPESTGHGGHLRIGRRSVAPECRAGSVRSHLNITMGRNI